MNQISAISTRAALDDEDLRLFSERGFLVVRGLLDTSTMASVSRWTDEVTGWPEVSGRHMVYYEDSIDGRAERVLSRIENFCPYHSKFDRLLNDGPVMNIVSSLFGSPAVMFKDKINYKMPGSDGFKAHQDVQAGWDRYASLHITMLLSIDSADMRNGCLELVAGAHRDGLLGESWTPLDDTGDTLEYLACPTEPGDVVFFDSFVPHRSAPNQTLRPRRILYMTYNRAEEGDHRRQYYADKRLSYPPDIEREPGHNYEYRV